MKTIILIHGLRGTHHGLLEIADNLSHKYKVITPDIPGSGARAELDNKTMDGYIEWLHGYIQNLNLKQKPYIIGHSMGSMIVSHYLDKYHNQVQQKTILLSPIFRTKTKQRFDSLCQKVLSFFLYLLPKGARTKLLRSKMVSYCISHYLTFNKSKQKQIDQLHYRYSGRFASADSIMADIKISMQMQTIIPPNNKVLCIIGDKDKMTSLPLAHDYANKEKVELRIVPNSGHLINYEEPQKVAEIIENFIK